MATHAEFPENADIEKAPVQPTNGADGDLIQPKKQTSILVRMPLRPATANGVQSLEGLPIPDENHDETVLREQCPSPFPGGQAAKEEEEDLGEVIVTPPLCSVETWKRTLRALGVIFGDIGTSPLYTISSIYCAPNCYTPQLEDMKGVFSNIFWSLIIITSIKYVIVLLSHMHHREGGIFALLSQTTTLSQRGPVPKGVVIFLTICAVFGSCALIADGIITPALSVLSAVAGFEDPAIAGDQGSTLAAWVPYITAVILLLLYAFQFLGTSKVGNCFGPICMIYFIFIASIGLYQLAINDGWEILEGVSPHYAVLFWTTGAYSGTTAFSMASSVVLAVTGSEAIYADGGHFGQAPVVLSWFGVCLPCALLSYAGQLALALGNPANISNPYFIAIPNGLYIPGVIISLLATLIASQAMISGCFSLVSQATNLDLFPPIKIVNTDPLLRGQIYVPLMNVFLGILCIAFVLGFQTSAALQNAYGMSVLLAFNMTAILLVAFLYYVKLPKVPLVLIILMLSPIIFVEVLYLASTFAYKLDQGGYAPLIIACFLSAVMLIWRYGRYAEELSAAAKQETSTPDERSLDALSSSTVSTTDCICVFLTRGDPQSDEAPLNVGLYRSLAGGALPRRCVVLTLEIRNDIAHVRQDHYVRLYRRGVNQQSTSFGNVYSAAVTLGYADSANREHLAAAVNVITEMVAADSIETQDDMKRGIADILSPIRVISSPRNLENVTELPPRQSRSVWFIGDGRTLVLDSHRNYVHQAIVWCYSIMASMAPKYSVMFEEAEDINFVTMATRLSV